MEAFNNSKVLLFEFSWKKWSVPVPERGCKKAGVALLFTRACRGKGKMVSENGIRLDTRKKLLPMGMVRHWHRLPIEDTDAPSLELSKAWLDRALSNLGQWKMSLSMAVGWNRMISKVPSNPNYSLVPWLFVHKEHLRIQIPAMQVFPDSGLFHMNSLQMNALVQKVFT